MTPLPDPEAADTVQTTNSPAVASAATCSPLSARYGRAIVMGHEWLDATSYAQGKAKPPDTWQTIAANCRITVFRKDGVYHAWSCNPDTKSWILPECETPEDAAKKATMCVAAHLRALADAIEANAGDVAPAGLPPSHCSGS